MVVVDHMDHICKQVSSCQRCDLWKTRTHPVVGEGPEGSKIMFIGEAPGFNEDKQGRPFVGRAGKILDELLLSIGLKREDVYITNILKCRPPNNRNPDREEIKVCTEYLDKQIDIIQPAILAPLGNFACQYLFEKYDFRSDTISKVHGKIFQKFTLYGPLYIMPMYHPAVATYNPTKKTELSEDFCKLQTILH